MAENGDIVDHVEIGTALDIEQVLLASRARSAAVPRSSSSAGGRNALRAGQGAPPSQEPAHRRPRRAGPRERDRAPPRPKPGGHAKERRLRDPRLQSWTRSPPREDGSPETVPIGSPAATSAPSAATRVRAVEMQAHAVACQHQMVILPGDLAGEGRRDGIAGGEANVGMQRIGGEGFALRRLGARQPIFAIAGRSASTFGSGTREQPPVDVAFVQLPAAKCGLWTPRST